MVVVRAGFDAVRNGVPVTDAELAGARQIEAAEKQAGRTRKRR